MRGNHQAARPLEDRVAVVTGAARGVGEALARSLSEAGMRVALLGRERATLREAAEALPGPSLCIECDVTDRAALADAARGVAAGLGPASVVVANAGIAVSGPFDRTAADLWQRVIDVNLTGSADTARAFLPQLTSTRGYFLQIASTAAFGAAPMMSAYCASKAGAESFALALRGEVEPDGVQVGIAYLHWTGTDMLTGIDDHPVLEALRRNQPRPARRVHSPAQVAQWLTRGVTHRAPQIYAPPWLRWCQPLRPLFPALVARAARRELRSLPREELSSPAEVLGAGGQADWNSFRTSRAASPPGG
ncbi:MULTISPECIES: SDR family oxidoreductase [Streptomyces]|uniref:SDR family oxidoreductase n=1 Tax=Streptomyces californicus TaxID=67351 RepID=A0ABD7D9U2_9ACTN|nr:MULTISPECIES: SDR family oxidoreductase [Streptomyces]MDP9947513.1 NAD(P)-dependent dehydrogenase (short-subunit alcohol dehydrogenase family) [Streptomyces sp. DSM 41269]QRV26098.1 SDR family oxidoreductase [Streptomyces californicus]QRV38239.1 SDR family oxidoreductase [Streptomyces californicus]QRV39500.1 SDR family oxidoreductase [Streptomyces californicus]QRV46249.1 SDR family oxidoreductase [Streptomyces californicus]